MKDGTIQKVRMTTRSYTLSEERNGVEGRRAVPCREKLKGRREGREREESRQENKITARDALAAKDFDCVHEVLNFFAVQKVAPLTS